MHKDSTISFLINQVRLNLSSTWAAALYVYMLAYGLPVNEDEWGADICSQPLFIVPFKMSAH